MATYLHFLKVSENWNSKRKTYKIGFFSYKQSLWVVKGNDACLWSLSAYTLLRFGHLDELAL